MSLEDLIIIDNLHKEFKIFKSRKDILKFAFLRDKNCYKPFKALDQIFLKIKKGDTLGVIGPNGSGKSTLLQIICGTLTPTTGTLIKKGRIAGLLELGSGFDPEFTGRENIYFNASLYGLSKSEVDTKLNEIINFSEINDFIDQKVKTYSSGMMLRLAFSVIAHVDADLLVIDEALAVGDAHFNQKCMRYIRKFRENGTLIIVSHDINAIINLCNKAIFLKNGKIKAQGSAKYVAEEYQQYINQLSSETSYLPTTIISENKYNKESNNFDLLNNYYGALYHFSDSLNESNGWKSGGGEIKSIKLISNDCVNSRFVGGETIKLVISAKAHLKLDKPIIGFMLRDRLGQDLFGENTLVLGESKFQLEKSQECHAEFIFKLPILPNGKYFIMASLANGSLHEHIQHHWLHDAAIIDVYSSNVRWGLVGIQFQKVTLEKSINSPN